MKAEIKRVHSPDIHDLSSYKPDDREDFYFLLQLMIGEKGKEGEESFDIIVCSPKGLMKNYERNDIIFGANHLIAFEYNYGKILQKLKDYIDGLDENNWDALAEKISRIAQWEFQDYKET